MIEEKPKPALVESKPQKSSLSWDFGSSTSLFGGSAGSSLSGNSDLMQLLSKMENKSQAAPKPAVEEDSEEDLSSIPEGMTASIKVDCLEEYFLDVGRSAVDRIGV